MKQLGTGAKIGLFGGMLGGITGLVVAAAFAPIMATIFFFVFIPVFGFMIVKVIRPMLRQDRLLQTGQPAEATILQIWDTSVTVNNKPQIGFRLQVRPGLGEPYEVEMRQVIPKFMLLQIQPGNVVAVRIDQNDRSAAVIELGKAPVTATTATATVATDTDLDHQTLQMETLTRTMQLQNALTMLSEFNEKVRSQGERAMAEITSMKQLAMDTRGGMLMEFTLKVQPDSGETFQAQARELIPQQNMRSYYEGKILTVWFNPGNVSEVALDG